MRIYVLALACMIAMGCSNSHSGSGSDAGAHHLVCAACSVTACDIDATLTGLPAMTHVTVTDRNRAFDLCGNAPPDVVVEWDPPVSGAYEVRVTGASGDAVLDDECVNSGGMRGCGSVASPPSLLFNGIAHKRVVVVADGASVGSEVTIGIYPIEICNDGIDNDLDGMTDCGDYKCMRDPACTTGM